MALFWFLDKDYSVLNIFIYQNIFARKQPNTKIDKK